MSYTKLKAGDEIPKSKYNGVCCWKDRTGHLIWNAQFQVNGKREKSHHQTEREAAKRYDMYLIRAGREPVNILKPKLND